MPSPGDRLLVISPVYNEGANLERTARSVAAQSLPPDRWVVVDDGSSDDTLEVARRLEREIDFMTVIEAAATAAPGADNLALAREAHAFNVGLEQRGVAGIRIRRQARRRRRAAGGVVRHPDRAVRGGRQARPCRRAPGRARRRRLED